MDARARDRVFMVSMHEPPGIALHKGFVDVAARRRVAHIVYLSFVGAGPGASFVHARSHGATEAMLADAGVPFTAVRNGMYADEVASWFDASGRITGPGGDGRISLTYRPELAEAIAVLLTDPSHDDRRAVTITGPESFTLAELAAVASDVTATPTATSRSARMSGSRTGAASAAPVVDRGFGYCTTTASAAGRGRRRRGRLPRADRQVATPDPRDDRAPPRRDAAFAGRRCLAPRHHRDRSSSP
jgi:uncharacterized protein YbjT (DUF2867 family)